MDERLVYAQEKSIGYLEFLELLLEDEHSNRNNNGYKKRYSKAKLPARKTIEDFDFSFQPSIDKRVINDCCTTKFVKEHHNVVFIGSPGVGKTHLAMPLGIKALMRGHKVLFTSVSEMLHNINASKADNTYYQKLAYYSSPDLPILDELGFKKLPSYSADDFFEVIAKRYEKVLWLLLPISLLNDGPEIFADQTLSQAILDRIVHYSTVIKITGNSYRAKNVETKKDEDLWKNVGRCLWNFT